MGKNLNTKAIILDLGGVIFENGTKITIKYINENYGIDKQILNNIFYGELSWELRKGKISYRSFWDSMYMMFPDFFEIVNNNAELYWHNSYTINPSILKLLANIKGSYTIGAISGNIRERIEFLEEKYHFSSLLDFAVYSFDFGEDKLSNKLYENAVFELNIRGIKPEESLFVDDNLDCLETASKLGFHTYLFKDIENFISENDQLMIKEI